MNNAKKELNKLNGLDKYLYKQSYLISQII
jgi:hypothetical protein